MVALVIAVNRLVELDLDAVQTGGKAERVLNLGSLMDQVVLRSGDSAQSLPICSLR